MQSLVLQGFHTNDESVARKPLSVRDLPAALEKQWRWFSTSIATSWASWSAIPQMDEVNDTIEEMISSVDIEKIPQDKESRQFCSQKELWFGV